MTDGVLAARWLFIPWPQYFNAIPAALLDACMARAEAMQRAEYAALAGESSGASPTVQGARTAYLKVYKSLHDRATSGPEK